jgi:Peptidase A4 family
MIRAAAALAVATALGFASPALADSSTQSSNWAGYAVHRSGVSFRQVSGSWTAPSATCTPGEPTFSSVWVGLGGYNERSKALEQIGTETDCKASGRATTSAWFELVPAPSRTIRMTIRAGDRLRASVNVTGHKVRVQLIDLTRHRSFTRTINDPTLDLTSAEWIVEAPSECAGGYQCQPLPLADFGSATITGARALTAAGYAGSIVNRKWVTTRITLAAGGQRRFVGNSAGAAGVVATPSALSGLDNSFTVTYGSSTTTTSPTTTAPSATAPTTTAPTATTPTATAPTATAPTATAPTSSRPFLHSS